MAAEPDRYRRLVWQLPDGEKRIMDQNQLFNWCALRMAREHNVGRSANPKPNIDHLYAAREALSERLKNGFTVIDKLLDAGQDSEKHLRVWLELLEEYRLVMDQIAAYEPDVDPAGTDRRLSR